MTDLTGQHVRLYPFEREGWPRDVLYALWRHVEDAGASTTLFYAQPGLDAQRGDLQEFVGYFTDPKRLVYLAQSTKNDELAGMVWFDDIQPGHRAAINVFFRRRAWGHPAREAVRLACLHAFERLRVQSIWAYTPWPAAWRMGEALGFQHIALLPEFVLIHGTPHDIRIMRLRKGELDG